MDGKHGQARDGAVHSVEAFDSESRRWKRMEGRENLRRQMGAVGNDDDGDAGGDVQQQQQQQC